jgi:hypothetical protein
MLVMVKPVGGRGHKAPYETTVIRIPVDIKSEVDRLVDNFRDGTNGDGDRMKSLVQLIQDYKLQSKSTRDWVKANKLIDELVVLLEIK